MSALKIVGIVVAVIVVLGGVTCGGAYLWFRQNSERLATEGKAAMDEGKNFGTGKSAQVCVDEALRRLTGDLGIIGEAQNKVFFESCLKVATLPEGFCKDIPPRSEIMRTATWAVARCASLSRSDQPCTRLVGAIQERCQKTSPTM